MKAAKVTPLKDVKESIGQQLLQTEKNEQMTKWVDDLTKDYEDKVSYAVGFSPPPKSTGTTTTTTPKRVVPLGEALVELDALTRRLRRDCPWDREQTARTIVPHTVEEAYEVADAAGADDPDKLLDELGDLLFQVYFLALLLEEDGGGDLERVARNVHEKLVRRHPHVFGDVEARTAGRVRERWEQVKAEQEGRASIFHDVPASLPALLQARKLQRRAVAAGFDWPDLAGPLAKVRESSASSRPRSPALASRAPRPGRTRRWRTRSATSSSPSSTSPAASTSIPSSPCAARTRASSRASNRPRARGRRGERWSELPLEQQDRYYDLAKEETG